MRTCFMTTSPNHVKRILASINWSWQEGLVDCRGRAHRNSATGTQEPMKVVQVNEIVDELPRVDIPASWVDVIVPADKPYQVEPLFTRDPRLITDVQILSAMMVIRGIYERHGVTTLNHGIGCRPTERSWGYAARFVATGCSTRIRP